MDRLIDEVISRPFYNINKFNKNCKIGNFDIDKCDTAQKGLRYDVKRKW